MLAASSPVGVPLDPAPSRTSSSLQGEEATAAAFERDPYGCGPDLREKRQQRDPFVVGGYTGDRCVWRAWCAGLGSTRRMSAVGRRSGWRG